jgi:hypothetical protein
MKKTRPALLASVNLLALVFLGAAGRADTGAQGLPPRPKGLVAVIADDPQRDELDLKALDNPYISGVALQIRWRDLEPAEGKPNWEKLDQLFAAAKKSNKWVQLLVFPGFFSPPWALKGADTARFPIQYGPDKGDLLPLPMPWDKTYLDRWLSFVDRLSGRYGVSPAFRVVAADGPTSVSAEYTLPSAPKDVAQWRKKGYTPQRYLQAWDRVFRAFAASFPNQYISVSLGFGLNINHKGRRDGGARERTKLAVLDKAKELMRRRLARQYSNLDGNPGPGKGPPGTDLVIGYSGSIVTGFQLRTSCERNSGDMGAAGDPALALKRAIDKGMRTNASGAHVDYIEVYKPDVMAQDLQDTLRYGAKLLGESPNDPQAR